jgi:hypothetical protein
MTHPRLVVDQWARLRRKPQLLVLQKEQMLRILPLLQGGLLEMPQDLVPPSQTMWMLMPMMTLKKKMMKK